MASPAPRPAALKLIEGRGHGRDSGGRLVKEAPEFVRLPPEPPEILSGEALAEWHRVVPELQRLHLTKPLDAAALTAYCLTWERLVTAQRMVTEHGITSRTSQGVGVAPWVRAVESASKELRAWCAEFGFTPSAEQKVCPARRTATTVTIPSPDELNISAEVRWYLHTRGIPLPSCPPQFKTPEPSMVPGARFDPERVDRVMRAMRALKHTQGRWAGRPLEPDPWQVAYILAPVYGWVRRNDVGDWVRIVRTEYVELPRKNGKTTVAGGQACYLTTADGEMGAQVIAAAAGRDQATYCFGPVKAIAERSPLLSPHVKVTANKIVHTRTGSYFTVVSSVADLLHGANVHGAVIDELHVHKTRDLVDALETGTGARDQPLIIIITTADDGAPATIYAEKRDYVERLARRTITDPTFYGVIWAADEDDQHGEAPFQESTWRRANPGYGISPTKAFMESEARKARQSPANRARFLRLHLGIRTRQQSRYIDLAVWDRNASIVEENKLAGRAAYGGLDLASTSDLCALAWDFPDGEGGHDVLWRLWVPEAAIPSLDDRTAGSASVWVRQGLLRTTPGNVTDYDFIRQQINADRETYDVREIGYDRWNATQLVNDLTADGADMVGVGQGFASMSGPTKELLRLLLEGTADRPRYRHGGNPAMRWQIDNLAVGMDEAGNVKPDKKRAVEKVDGVVAAVMALGRAIAGTDAEQPSAYDGEHDLLVL